MPVPPITAMWTGSISAHCQHQAPDKLTRHEIDAPEYELATCALILMMRSPIEEVRMYLAVVLAANVPGRSIRSLKLQSSFDFSLRSYVSQSGKNCESDRVGPQVQVGKVALSKKSGSFLVGLASRLNLLRYVAHS
jgi:hypothetical protein